MNSNNKILVVGPAWVGDMVMAQTLFTLLRQQNPQVLIDVIAPDWSRPLLERMPEVNKAIVMPLGHGQLGLKTRYQLGKSLRAEVYQQAIVLPNSFKSALVPYWAKVPVRTGWSRELRSLILNDVRHLDKQQLPLMIERFMALGIGKAESLNEPYPRPSLQISAENVSVALQRYALTPPSVPVLVICPGAEFGPAKRWPEDKYAEVVKAKLAEGWQVWIFGSKKDQPVAAAIQALTEQQCVDLTGRTSLADAIDLMSLATQVVSNDSGLMHIAAALNKPLVAVYGSSSAKFTPPLNDHVRMISQGLACSPCFQRECPLGHLNCLKQLPAEKVLSALKELAVE